MISLDNLGSFKVMTVGKIEAMALREELSYLDTDCRPDFPIIAGISEREVYLFEISAGILRINTDKKDDIGYSNVLDIKFRNHNFRKQGFVPEGYVGKDGLKGFPTDVINAMLIEQSKQGVPMNLTVFESSPSADVNGGGFSWGNASAPDGHLSSNYWGRIIGDRVFDEIDKYYKEFPAYAGRDEGAPEIERQPHKSLLRKTNRIKL